MESETLKEYGSKGYLKSSSDSEEWKSFSLYPGFSIHRAKQFAGHRSG